MNKVQCSLFIMLNVGAYIGTDHVISELCYKVQGTIFFKGIIGKWTILWSISKITWLKTLGATIVVSPNPCYNEVCYKGNVL